MWGGRFSEATDSFVAAFTASVGFDQRFAKHDIQSSVAHATMLGRCGILTSEEVDTIIEGLHKVQQEIDAGEFNWSIALEDVHMNVESRLTDIIGTVGKKLTLVVAVTIKWPLTFAYGYVKRWIILSSY